MPADSPTLPPAPPPGDSFLDRVDARFEKWSERFNPIVVKETRQAIRSRGFLIAFLVMLALCLLGSLVLVVDNRERLHYAEIGPEFFQWYLAVLLGAICFVVPLGLFRGVVAEFDGQTFELLAISTLSARQIVFGKLKSATLQMLAFYSAAAPFLCFTYLLEGLSLPGIFAALITSYLAGLSSCMGAMMLAALAKQSAWQVPCLLGGVLIGAVTFGLGLTTGIGAARFFGDWSSLGELCAGLGCFGYVFLFFSLLTLGVSIAQFTPTMPRPGRIAPYSPGLRSGPAADKAASSAAVAGEPAATTGSPWIESEAANVRRDESAPG